MKNQKTALWLAASIFLIGLGGLALPGAASPSTFAQAPLDPVATEMVTAAPRAAAAFGDPASITMDEQGYTVWTYEYPDLEGHCWMLSRLRWPFNLGAQDPSELSETTLIFNFGQRQYATGPDGEQRYTNPTWAVALNGKPGAWVDGSFSGDWNIIGAIGIEPTWPFIIPAEQEIAFDHTELIDGENNIWFQQQDFCGTPDFQDMACTCYQLYRIRLRARVKLGIKELSPKPGTEYVNTNQHQRPEIRVLFNTIVSDTTVNENTFQVYYLDEQQQPVYVSGEPRKLSDVEYIFRPDAPLRDGIRYQARVWGETEATAEKHADWVQDVSGGPLESGAHWPFWTLPQLEVRLAPVQVLEEEALVAYKPTVLRVFLSSASFYTDVWYLDLWDHVDVEDIELSWRSPSGEHEGAASWRASGPPDWHFAYTPETARRYRLNDKFRRLSSQDTVNYYGFVPQETGYYWLRAAVTVVDSRGEKQRFVRLSTPDVVQTRWLTLHARALAVGADYGKSGTVDLSAPLAGHRGGVQAIYPVPNVRLAQRTTAIPYYAPVASSVWSSSPAGDFQLLKALLEMSSLCATSSGCDLMIGYAPMAWLRDIGLTSPRQAWYGMLVQDVYYDHFRFIVAHEGGHLYGFEHDTYSGGDGYDVRRRADRRNSAAGMEPQTQKTLNIISSFMNEDPVESPPPERLWIEWRNYHSLRARFSSASRASRQASLAEPLLLASGIITPASGAVALDPWYQLEAGEWEAPAPGPYRLVFLDGAGQEIAGYTRPFSTATTLQPAGRDSWTIPPDAPAPFAIKVPYPAATARVQIRRDSDDALLAERTASASAPTVAITSPANTSWTGPQPIAWQTDPAQARHFILQVSTDNGATWQAQAIHLPGTTYTVETTSLPNTTQALVRVIATDGLNTASDSAGLFTIDNPARVEYVLPTPGAEHVNVEQPLHVGFRDAIDAATIHSGTLTLSGGPGEDVPGYIRYDAETREATFIPKTRLAYSTTYTAHVSAAIRTPGGSPLAGEVSWTFSTEADSSPPRPSLFSPPHGALNVPTDTVVAVAWDRALEAGTVSTASFQVAELHGALLSGSVAYDAAARMATFTPATPLAPRTTYVVTLSEGIRDTQGNASSEPAAWVFSTGGAAAGLAFTGSYADSGLDADGDGLYEHLDIRVGVRVTATGSYVLRGALADAEGVEITWAYLTSTLSTGVHLLGLRFDGAAIGGRGLDGPYTLTDLVLTHTDSGAYRPAVLASTSKRDAYRTFAYPAGHFPAPLRFGGLPDVLLLPGTTFHDAFNVRDYARHATLPGNQLSYTLMLNTQPAMGVALQASGAVHVRPEAYWKGRARVTIRASDGVYAVQDTFEIAIGWPQSIYLPVVLRNEGGAGGSAARDGWITYFHDDFEASFSWLRYSSISIDPGGGIPLWDKRDCRVYSGQYSAWSYGGINYGDAPACGAEYPNTLWTMMYKYMPIDLRYVAHAQYSAKVWTNLPPGDEVCLQVAVVETGACQSAYGNWPAGDYYGVCRSGVTDGWEDLTIDLANVPTLGNVLGQERVCIAAVFAVDEAGTRPEGAYLDDVSLRLCPEGLSEHCAGTSPSPPASPPLVAANIGGYPESVIEAAVAVEDSGRVHALWTGKLNPNVQNYVFYSSSPDGANWTPYRILSYWGGREPQVAVDNVHGRIHLAYGNDDGVVHHTVAGGVVSAPEIVAPHKRYYLPDLDLPGGGVAFPSLTVAEGSGYAYLVWREVYWARLSTSSFSARYQTWHAYWDGASWSAPLSRINDRDTQYSTIVAAPDGQAMLAWFQRWSQSAGDGVSPGDPIVARTAYGTEPGRFPLRQATHELYSTPQRDQSIVLAYSGGDDSFVLGSDHAMWPGHSRVYRYVWKDGAWAGPVSVAENSSGWATPVYVGAAADTPLIRYVYRDDYVLKTRTETGGVLSPAQDIADYLSARGYTNAGSPLAYFTGRTGGLHMVVNGEKDGTAGFYYVRP
ncbi:MAG: Ig-like domain-containing protein [Thermoflexales bacterium]|nr:Ig-like domain-containing protein [Thermoflexales bacterium]